MILCLTPNPAIDRTLIIPRFVSGATHRATEVIVAAGGKGLNVARAIRTLGGEPVCMGFLAGHTGHWVAELAQREGGRAAWTWIEGETRTCVIVAPTEAGEPSVIQELGPSVQKPDWDRLTTDVLREAAALQYVCLCGSLPPGAAVEWFAALLEALIYNHKQVWVDTSGAALRAALTVPGVNVKVNAQEIEAALLAKPAPIEAAQLLRSRGVDSVAITLGRQGAVMATAEGEWHVQSSAMKAVSAVGSGDSFLAGLQTGLEAGMPAPEALRRAAAAGAANALSIGGGRIALGDFMQMLAQTSLQPDRHT
jgi:1-phosphofructokinase family hexose kinase